MESFWLLTCLLGCSIWTVGYASDTIATVSLCVAATNTINEDDPFGRIEITAAVDDPLTNGDLEVEYVLDDIDAMPDVEPGFDFTPSLGEFPYTIKLIIEESNTESKPFILQILDDCHADAGEMFRVTPVSTYAYTTNGDLYSVENEMSDYAITEGTPDTGKITIRMTAEIPNIGLVFFEGETNTKVPITGFECSDERSLPIDLGTCTTSVSETASDDLDTDDYTIPASIEIESDDESFDIDINDDDIFEEPESITLDFEQTACAPDISSIELDQGDLLIITIIDNDDDIFYGIVSPATIGRKESRDVNVYAVTTRLGANRADTSIERNTAVCPYTAELPSLCKTTDLVCKNEVYGTCTLFPKPKRYSRDRFGSYVITATYTPAQSIPVFVLPFGDVLSPLRGPTITINNGENVVIGVEFSSFTHELRWRFNGKPLTKYRGKCNFEIKNAQLGTDDGYYEVTRVQRGDSGWRTIIRLIIRECPADRVTLSGDVNSCTTSCTCYNGGICPDTDSTDTEWKCVCPLGFYGKTCATVYPDNIRIGPPAKGFTCRDLDKNIPRDCKGVLFCYADPLGCQCARGYWGPKCDRGCGHGRFGPNCLQRCHCVGPWDSCDPKTGICKSWTCDSQYDGPNCQVKLVT